MNIGALSGLKVVEYSQFISGSYCAKLLADLGAEAVKVEKPGFGDKARSFGPFPQDIPDTERSGLFLYLNTNKLGVTLNVETATGIKVFKELVKWADVLVENNPPREMKELGLDYESLHKVNPRLVVTSITPFGQTGLYRDYKACDLISFHVSGQAYISPGGGVEDIEQQPPLKGPAHAADFMAGLSGAVSTMSAVMAQQATGLGQHVDLSEQETLASITRHEVGIFNYEGIAYSREKRGKGGGTTVYPCKDGYVVMSALDDAFWAGLTGMMGNPDWAQRELCQDRYSRRVNAEFIDLIIAEWTREHTTEEINQESIARRFPCSPVRTAKEAVNSEQLAAREFFVEINHKETGRLKYPGAPYKLSVTPWRVRRPAPLLGEHNEEVYCQMLGYTRQDLAKMRGLGVI